MVFTMVQGLLGIPFGFFSPQSPQGHRGIYHSNFNDDNFKDEWWNHLLPNLTLPNLVIIDNAFNHTTKPNGAWSNFHPHYLELQPIEILLTQIIGNVAVQYRTGSILSEVKSLLKFEFSPLYFSVSNHGIRNTINHVDKGLKNYNNQVLEPDR